MKDVGRLHELLKAGHPAISIVTQEEADALEVVRQTAAKDGAYVAMWTLLDGVKEAFKKDATPQKDTTDPATALYFLSTQTLPAIHVLLDISDHLENPRVLRALRTLIESVRESRGHVIAIDHSDKRPDVLKAHMTPFELCLPTDDEIEQIVKKTLRGLHKESPIDVNMSKSDFRMIIKNLRGLTRRHAEQVVRDVVATDRKFDAEDLNDILAIKRKLVASEGALEYVESPATLDHVGGLHNLKDWLRQRSGSFDEEASAYGLKPPKGVLMLGVQGAGKSLCAKAIATAWQRPLLKMDPGGLYDRYVGESERRLRDALHQAEAMAPIILWIDEIEKGFASAASQSTDGGLSQRMFGTLLTWMNDHAAPVFIVATANNMEALPPELLRKGRFDEIFFVDLPGPDSRKKIFEIHIKKRKRDPREFDLERLAEAADGFSGAEIEQAVVGALHRAYSEESEPTTDMVVHQIVNSPPLSVTMAEKIADLRAWARGRCVPAE